MNDCIFCKIAAGEIPSSVVYEDEYFKVILDKFPGAVGHTLIVPKSHANDIFDLDEESAKRLYPLAQKIASAIKISLNPDGINIVQNNGKAAGQTVFHFHMHIIPRFKDDSVRIGWASSEASNETLADLNAKIKAGLGL